MEFDINADFYLCLGRHTTNDNFFLKAEISLGFDEQKPCSVGPWKLAAVYDFKLLDEAAFFGGKLKVVTVLKFQN